MQRTRSRIRQAATKALRVCSLIWRSRSRLRWSATRTISQDPTIVQGRLNEQPARLAVLERADSNCYFIAVLQIFKFPAALHEYARTAHLNTPMLHRSFFLRYIHFDVSMRIGPLECAHGARQSDLFCLIEHGERVMRYRCPSSSQHGCREGGQTEDSSCG